MKKAVMYGAGNIGRGFLGELFSKGGYKTVFVDINEDVVSGLNSESRYPVYVTVAGKYERCEISNVSAVNGRDIEAVAREIASTDIMATAVGVNVLPRIAGAIAAGIERRAAQNPKPLNIIICENMVGADEYLRSLIAPKLSPLSKKYFERSVGLCEASVGRMVPACPSEMLEREPLAVCVEEFCTLYTDREAYKGEIPEIPGILPCAPFELYIKRKLFMHNMSHAVCAYLGYAKGYEYIYEAVRDGEIRRVVSGALSESAVALAAEYGADERELTAYGEDLLRRYDNVLLGDSVERVGRDSARKLSISDRLTGAAKLCMSHGIKPVNIAKGIAAAFEFAPENDAVSAEVSLFAAENGLRAALEKYSGTSGELADMVIEQNALSNRRIRVLFIGNSLTRHSPAPDLGWYGDCGMAASDENKDYVHLTVSFVEKDFGLVCFRTASVPPYERALTAEDGRDYKSDENFLALTGVAARFKPDAVVLQMGENVSCNPTKEQYADALTQLVEGVRAAVPGVKIMLTASFWGGDAKVSGAKFVSEKLGIPCADLSVFDSDENKAFGRFEHKGVASHPGDAGMEKIANAVYEKLKTLLK